MIIRPAGADVATAGESPGVSILSPHLDDAVMSLGATIAALVRTGVAVELITVFAGDPERSGRPSYWDSRRHVNRAAEAFAARRAEDAAAAQVLGITTHWLPFDDGAYVGARDPDTIWKLLHPLLATSGLVLLPGWPLRHADHRWVTMLVKERLDDSIPVAFYCELPYSALLASFVKAKPSGRSTGTLSHLESEAMKWAAMATTREDRRAKARAVAAYAGEISSLGRRARIAKAYDRLSHKEIVGYPQHHQLPAVLRLTR